METKVVEEERAEWRRRSWKEIVTLPAMSRSRSEEAEKPEGRGGRVGRGCVMM